MLAFLISLGVVDSVLSAAAGAAALMVLGRGLRWFITALEVRPGDESLAEARTATGKAFVLFAALFVAASSIPSRRALVESYAMAEASKLATSDNAKVVADEVLKRVDAYFGASEKSK
jgi:hypothetical protein